MILRGLAFILAFSSALNSFAMNHGFSYHKSSLFDVARKLRVDGTMRSEEIGWYNQKLDHADDASSETFKQRYFVDSQYAEGPLSPVFYIICGEWNCGGTGSYSFIENVAKNSHRELLSI